MSGERKGKKLRRQAKGKIYYASQGMRTETNRKRRMRNHIRSHPGDRKAATIYEQVKKFGSAASFVLTSKGRKLHKRYERETLLAAGAP
jgi:hypothetical protein